MGVGAGTGVYRETGGWQGPGGALQSPPSPPQAFSLRKLALAALFTSAEWHLVSRAEDRVCFPKERRKIWG